MSKLQDIGKQVILEEKQNEYLRRMRNDSRMTGMFSSQELDEDEDGSALERKQDVIYRLEHNMFEEPNPEEFRRAMNKSKRGEMLTDYSTAELSQMKLFKLKDYDIGYALKKRNGKYNEIVSGFNNDPIVRNIGPQLIASALKNGGCWIDHFDGYLSTLYSSLGFVEYKRDKFDPQYDPDGSFRKKYGPQDVIYRVHKSCM